MGWLRGRVKEREHASPTLNASSLPSDLAPWTACLISAVIRPAHCGLHTTRSRRERSSHELRNLLIKRFDTLCALSPRIFSPADADVQCQSGLRNAVRRTKQGVCIPSTLTINGYLDNKGRAQVNEK